MACAAFGGQRIATEKGAMPVLLFVCTESCLPITCVVVGLLSERVAGGLTGENTGACDCNQVVWSTRYCSSIFSHEWSGLVLHFLYCLRVHHSDSEILKLDYLTFEAYALCQDTSLQSYDH